MAVILRCPFPRLLALPSSLLAFVPHAARTSSSSWRLGQTSLPTRWPRSLPSRSSVPSTCSVRPAATTTSVPAVDRALAVVALPLLGEGVFWVGAVPAPERPVAHAAEARKSCVSSRAVFWSATARGCPLPCRAAWSPCESVLRLDCTRPQQQSVRSLSLPHPYLSISFACTLPSLPHPLPGKPGSPNALLLPLVVRADMKRSRAAHLSTDSRSRWGGAG